mmetsp:Transcript_11143/g.26774  ORF Transcript_11143/g.26774 Transcript_11143/m.26774 type:complete len:491 (-) Transcript_11143:499-1971(-)
MRDPNDVTNRWVHRRADSIVSCVRHRVDCVSTSLPDSKPGVAERDHPAIRPRRWLGVRGNFCHEQLERFPIAPSLPKDAVSRVMDVLHARGPPLRRPSRSSCSSKSCRIPTTSAPRISPGAIDRRVLPRRLRKHLLLILDVAVGPLGSADRVDLEPAFLVEGVVAHLRFRLVQVVGRPNGLLVDDQLGADVPAQGRPILGAELILLFDPVLRLDRLFLRLALLVVGRDRSDPFVQALDDVRHAGVPFVFREVAARPQSERGVEILHGKLGPKGVDPHVFGVGAVAGKSLSQEDLFQVRLVVVVVVPEAHDVAPQAQSDELVAGLGRSGCGALFVVVGLSRPQPAPDHLDEAVFPVRLRGKALLRQPAKVVRCLAGLVGLGPAFLLSKGRDLVVVPGGQPVDGISQVDQELGVGIVVLPGMQPFLQVDPSGRDLGKGANLGLDRIGGGGGVFLLLQCLALDFGFLDHELNRAPAGLSYVHEQVLFGTVLDG